LPSAPHLPLNSLKEYDLVKKIKNTPAKISLWDLIHNFPSYHAMLQTTFQKVPLNPNTNTNDVETLVQKMNTINENITFLQHELPPLGMRKINDAFVIIARYKKKGIKRTLVDNGFSLNVCSMNLLDRLGVEKSEIRLNSLSIKGFNNMGKEPLYVITFPILVKVVTLQTPIHAMPSNLSYNIVLG
jgi:hypothetical protein